MATRPVLLLILAAAAVFSLAPCTADNAISSPGTLFAGQFLTTGNYQFIMQTDCNLVLYEFNKITIVHWASHTANAGLNCRAVLRNNGNLVIYDRRFRVVWSSNTHGRIANYALVLQGDGKVVIHGPVIWSTGTHTGTIGVTVVAQNSTAVAAAAEQVIVTLHE